MNKTPTLMYLKIEKALEGIKNQMGVIHILPLFLAVAAIGVVSFVVVSSTAPLNDDIFSRFNQKPASHAADILWSAGHETGNKTEWTANSCGGEFNSDNCGGGIYSEISSDVAHTGTKSLKTVLNNGCGGVRLFHWCESHENPELYYSTWVYFPKSYSAGWWNVFQWKTRLNNTVYPLWAIQAAGSGADMMFRLDKYNPYIDGQFQTSYKQSTKTIPVGQWVHLEALYRYHTNDGYGDLAVWQDGVQIFNLTNVEMRRPGDQVEWSINNYSTTAGGGGVSPAPAVIYFDDAAISRTRIGPGGSSTPTATPTPASNTTVTKYWQAGHESGTTSEWLLNGGGDDNVNTGTGTGTISSDVAHSGSKSLKMTISNADGLHGNQAVRFFRWNSITGYYSAWYYFPQNYSGMNWWNVFQWKDTLNNPSWVVNVENVNGQMRFWLWDDYLDKVYSQSTATIPVGQWVHLEAYYKIASDNTGRVTLYQNGQQIIDAVNVKTVVPGAGIYWGVSNYTDKISPTTATIYVDDAVISSGRVWPGSIVTNPTPVLTPVPTPVVTPVPTPTPTRTPTPTPAITCPVGQFKADYYNGKTSLESPVSSRPAPVLSRCEAVPLNYNWGTSAPVNGLSNDNFSVNWNGDAYFEGGNYTFNVSNDDGMRIWIDYKLVYDSWFDQGAQSRSFTVDLVKGNRHFGIDYYENLGEASASLNWILNTPIPTPTATPTPALYSTSLEAEKLGLIANSGAIQIFNDSLASMGQGLIFYSNATSTTQYVNILSNSKKLTVRAKANVCKGNPRMVVKVDGVQVLNTYVSSTSWVDYSSGLINVGAGSHTVTVSYDNDYYKNNCDRNLRIDKLLFAP